MELKFETKITKIKDMIIVRIPQMISAELPSRGMVMVKAVIHGVSFIAPLEPDGNRSHWMEITEEFMKEIHCAVQDTVLIEMDLVNQWEEPKMPADIMEAIFHFGLEGVWQSITPKAKWEWLRWIRSTNCLETRQKRIGVACSKLSHGEKRPCCFDQTRCTVPEVSKTGVLLEEPW